MKVAKTSNLKFVGQPKRGSKFDKVFEELTKLKVGQSLLVPIGAMGEDIEDKRVAHNRLNAALHRAGPNPPKGCRFQKRTTVDGEIAISVVTVKAAPKKEAKAKKRVKRPAKKAKAKKKKARKR